MSHLIEERQKYIRHLLPFGYFAAWKQLTYNCKLLKLIARYVVLSNQ